MADFLALNYWITGRVSMTNQGCQWQTYLITVGKSSIPYSRDTQDVDCIHSFAIRARVITNGGKSGTRQHRKSCLTVKQILSLFSYLVEQGTKTLYRICVYRMDSCYAINHFD